MESWFPDLVREIDADPTDERSKARWKTVDRLGRKASASQLLDYVRVFYGRRPKSSDFRSNMRSEFQKDDATFVSEGNEQEVAVLAGAIALRGAQPKESRHNSIPVLAISCLSLQGNGAVGASERVVRESWKRLDNIRRALRTVYGEVGEEHQTEAVEVPDSLKEAYKQSQWQNVTSGLYDVVGSLIHKSSANDDRLVRLRRAFWLQHEELQMLWWVIGGFSWTLMARMGDLDIAGRVPAAAYELADLTVASPGPLATRSMLQRAIGSHDNGNTSLTLPDLLKQLQKPFQDRMISALDFDYSDLCPLHSLGGMAYRQEAVDIDSDTFGSEYGIAARGDFNPVDLGLQLYEEAMLLAAVKVTG